RWAMEQQIAVGEFFDAEDFVEVSQVHICADSEALGPSGVAFLEKLAGAPAEQRRVSVPTVTDPRGADFARVASIKQPEAIVALERRAADALATLGMILTDTCINYQSVLPPVRGEHLAFGDTGSVIYANSVCGARSNYEGGPAALAAALTGRVPRYGFHLDACRRGHRRWRVTQPPRSLSDWGALGALVGRAQESYWQVPVVEPAGGHKPTSDQLKHFGAAMASWGSTAMYHVCSVTPEAPPAEPGAAALELGHRDIDAFYDSFAPSREELDVVVFAAPQLSLLEMQQLARLLEGRRVHEATALLVATSPEIRHAAARAGLVAAIERAGGVVLEGVCFYQMHARVLAEANGWRTLMTNSAKLVNIIAGYGYEPALAPMERCVEAAVSGRIVR
ncbi:MAG TPA: aconitase X, partial [Geminicoccaceae bacterium]|nr:aconitase X [Geminicoccaceae bacterium]